MQYSLIPEIIVIAAIVAVVIIVLRRLPDTKKISDKHKENSTPQVMRSTEPQEKKRGVVFKLSSVRFPKWKRDGENKGSFFDQIKNIRKEMASKRATKRGKQIAQGKDEKAQVAKAKLEVAKKVAPDPEPKVMVRPQVSDEEKNKIRDLSWEARKAMKKNDYKAAEELYQQVIDMHGEDIDAYKGLGGIYMQSKRNEKAAEVYQKVVRFNARDEKAYLHLGEAYLHNKKFDDSVEALEKVITLNPQSSEAFVLLGQAHDGLNLTKESLKDFEQAVHHNPENPEYLIMLAEASEKRGLKVEAKMNLRKVLDLDKDNSQAQRMLEKLG